MMDLNHVILIGRLTRDAEYKILPSGQAVCNFSIAVNRRKKVGENWEDEANYFDIVLWGKQADSLNRYLVKGKQVGVDGELRQDRWQQDGQNRSRVVVSVNNLQLLGGGPGGGGPGGGYSGDSGGGQSSGGPGGGRNSSYSGGGYGGGQNSPAASGYGGGAPTGSYGGGDAPPTDAYIDDEVPF